jgi:hypothetical protein
MSAKVQGFVIKLLNQVSHLIPGRRRISRCQRHMPISNGILPMSVYETMGMDGLGDYLQVWFIGVVVRPM